MFKITKMLTVVLAVTAMLAFSGVADAAIIVNGAAQSDPLTTSGVYNMNNSGTNTIDGGSTWTHNTDLFKLGNQSAASSMTISGGGFLDITAGSVGDTYAFQVGNKALGTMVITGTGSTVKTLTSTAIGRYSSASAAHSGHGSTITIDDGGLLISEVVKIGRDANSASVALRMGAGGILAIEGTGKTLTSQLWNTDQSGTGNMMQYNPSGDGTTWVNITGATAGVDYTLADGNGALAGYSVLTMAAIPEPTTMSLLAIGGLGLLLKRRRRRA